MMGQNHDSAKYIKIQNGRQKMKGKLESEISQIYSFTKLLFIVSLAGEAFIAWLSCHQGQLCCHSHADMTGSAQIFPLS